MVYLYDKQVSCILLFLGEKTYKGTIEQRTTGGATRTHFIFKKDRKIYKVYVLKIKW